MKNVSDYRKTEWKKITKLEIRFGNVKIFWNTKNFKCRYSNIKNSMKCTKIATETSIVSMVK